MILGGKKQTSLEFYYTTRDFAKDKYTTYLANLISNVGVQYFEHEYLDKIRCFYSANLAKVSGLPL